jgi:macrolide transport system ATP-binding/permease protein
MQAGFTYRPIIARRDGAQTQARSVMGEFVSGNYFRTFGLSAAVGKAVDGFGRRGGRAGTAVMSYATWQRDFAGDAAVVGSTFWVNTKPVTVVGIAPRGFYGDRLTSTPPDFYLPMETMTVLANVTYVHEPTQDWLYIVGRVKPGTAMGPLQEKVSAVVRQAFAQQANFKTQDHGKMLAKVHVVLTPGGGGIQSLQEEYASHLHC